jgi:hypothetical protein
MEEAGVRSPGDGFGSLHQHIPMWALVEIRLPFGASGVFATRGRFAKAVNGGFPTPVEGRGRSEILQAE